jgi:diadenosine tetraphosphatase ApaH/serine/threonine PP2A family protein phosphatase
MSDGRRAILYDIHGNLPALEAVLADASADTDRFVLGGDYTLFGAFANETVDRLRGLDATWIRGNGERWTSNASEAPDDPLVQRSIVACREQLGEQRVTELASLPATAPIGEALFCHGSPSSDVDTFMPDDAGRDEELLAGAEQPLIVFGHSHLQFRRRSGGRTLVNPGSVGMPFDADRRAAYALWDGDDRFELRRVEYDADGYVQAVKERLGPSLADAAGTLVRRLEQASFVV